MTKKLSLYAAVAILVVGSLFGLVNLWSQGFLSNASSSSTGAQQGAQNQAAQSSIAIESANFVTGGAPSVTVTVRNVGAVAVTLGSITIHGDPSNPGFRSYVSESPGGCYPSSTLPRGGSCSYTSNSPDLAGLREGDIVNVRVTTNVGTFASAQFTASGGAPTLPSNSDSQQGVTGTGTSQKSPYLPTSQVQFFANLTLKVASPQTALDKVEAIAFSNGGYIAHSSMTNVSAYAVVRVPPPNYEIALTAIESVGNITSRTTTSNDVTVRVIDLNATLQSFEAERASIVKLMNQSYSTDSTLKTYSQLQSIDAEINSVKSQILNTKRLVEYSTITADMIQAAHVQPLTAKVMTTPHSGSSPLAVTFNTAVHGGTAPYSVTYNFGDSGTGSGQLIVHTFSQPGDYNVTITVADSTNNTLERWVMIHVTGASPSENFSQFTGYATGLFLGVVEGIIEVAAVSIPILLVLAAIIIPISKKLFSSSKGERKSQS